MTTRTEVQSNIALTPEDKIRNVKYMIVQLHYHVLVSFYEKDGEKYCNFTLSNSNIWKINYNLNLDYCFDYKLIYDNENGEEYQYYQAIFKDLKLILLSEEDNDWFVTLFDCNNEDIKNAILDIKENIYKPILMYIKEEIGDTNIKNLMLALSEV